MTIVGSEGWDSGLTQVSNVKFPVMSNPVWSVSVMDRYRLLFNSSSIELLLIASIGLRLKKSKLLLTSKQSSLKM